MYNFFNSCSLFYKSKSRKSTWEKATGYSDEVHFEEFKDKVVDLDDNKDDF